MRRIAGLYNGIVLLLLEVQAWDRLISHDDLSDGSLELVFNQVDTPTAQWSLFEAGTPARVQLAALSFDNCVKVVEVASGIIALLTKR